MGLALSLRITLFNAIQFLSRKKTSIVDHAIQWGLLQKGVVIISMVCSIYFKKRLLNQNKSGLDQRSSQV